MKSEKAEQKLRENKWLDDDTDCYVVYIRHAESAVVLAEQEAEERMRRKAKEAFISCCDCEEFQYDGKKCENCDTYKSFIQKLTENENDD